MTDRWPQTSVGAVVIHEGSLLLVERGRAPAKGQWSLPGGRVEWGETLNAAVVREVAEETGINVACGPFIGMVERISDSFHFVILDFYADPTSGTEARAGDDAADVAWIPVGRLTEVDLVDGLLDFLVMHGIIDTVDTLNSADH